MEVIRREARILDMLDSVSVENRDPAALKLANGEARSVIPGAMMILEQSDHELVKKRVEGVPWLPVLSRQVVDLVDWLKAAPEHMSMTEESTERG